MTRKWCYMKRSIVTKIIAIFIVFGIIPMLFFTYMYNVSERKNNEALVKESLSKLASEKSKVLYLQLEEFENEILNLGQWIEFFMVDNTESQVEEFNKSYGISYKESSYIEDSKGVYNKLQRDDRSSIYIPLGDQMDKNRIDELIKINRITPYLIKAEHRLDNMSWIYFISKNNVMSIAPSTEISVFGYNHNFEEDIYYKLATPTMNPEKKVLWTEPYYDWLGEGWTITCTLPVYVANEFMGVVAADFPLNKLNATIEDFTLLESGFAFLIDQQGNVIYHPDANDLSKGVGDSLSMNLLKGGRDASYEDILTSMTKGESGFSVYVNELSNDLHAVSYISIDEMNWSLGIEVDWSTYQDVSGMTQNYLVTLILPLIAVFTIIGIFLFRNISKPLIQLMHQAEKISAGDFTTTKVNRSSDEIGILEQTFDHMTQSISNYTRDLLHKNREIEAIFNNIPGLLYIIDDQYNIIGLNKNSVDILAGEKRTASDLENCLCYNSFFNRDIPCINCPIKNEDALKGETVSDISNDNRLYKIRSYPVFKEDNTVKEWVLFGHEITDEFVMEKMIAQSEKMAGVGQIVAGFTHELKNPMTAIKGTNHLLKAIINNSPMAQNDMAEIEVLLDQISESVKRSENIIYNLLDFSKPSKQFKEVVDINRIITQVLSLEGHQFLMNNVKVTCEYENEKQWVFCNRDALKHIFLNLISNAIQAMPENGGELKVSVRVLENDLVEVRVKDNGVGIPKPILSKVFEPFYSTKEKQNHGLGLWIAKKELEKVGASIQINSTIGIGTEIELIFTNDDVV